ncbi:hypothetical protein LCGC14_1182310 [marine sediment metagenome]|uniref:Uncharacterized protein n=1 Tax=marine sediment metagenome TaxID=412755 RepID=A0A0F9PS86_9ZZZZ
MSHLKEYVEGLNRMSDIFGGEQIDLDNLDDAVAQRIFNSLDSDLSPENLTCDGELSFAAVQKKARILNGAATELMAMGFQFEEE